MNWLLYLTINDISVINVTAHTCAGRLKKNFGPTCTVGLPHHRHFVWFFNMPVQAPTRDQPFYVYSEKPAHFIFSRPLQRAWEYGGSILVVPGKSPSPIEKMMIKSYSWQISPRPVLSKYVEQSDIFLMSVSGQTKNVGVPDQMSDRQ